VRRAALIGFTCAALAGLAAGCGAQGVVSPTPQTVIGTVAQAAPEPATPAFKVKGNPTAGKAVFLKAGCVSCHTLADAKATGTVGPNLDDAKPDYRLVTARVTLGKGVMPSFKSQLSTKQIADVGAYVVKATGGTPP
jgi:mono/diheme cytochrome c family protein